MRKRFFQSVWVIFVACTLLLSGCGDSDETKSQRLLMQAETLMQQGSEEKAEQVLADIVARYPATQSGATANKRLLQIRKQRELEDRASFVKILDSYQQVLKGYHALYAEYPQSISVLDQSDYFFDSAYLQEITPENYQAYLWLKKDGSGYRVWCANQEDERGYVVDSESRKLVPFDRDETLGKIKARFQASAWDDRLVILQTQK